MDKPFPCVDIFGVCPEGLALVKQVQVAISDAILRRHELAMNASYKNDEEKAKHHRAVAADLEQVAHDIRTMLEKKVP